MSYSILSRKRRQDFEGKDYKKLLKYVYYYGKPNNDRTEYFALEHLIFEWIRKTIHWNLSKNIYLDKKDNLLQIKKFRPGVLNLDYFILHWEISFYIEEKYCWFIGPVLLNDSVIVLKTKNFLVKLQYGEAEDNNIYNLENIKFKGPPPNVQSITYEGENSYFLNVKWDNSFSKKMDVPTTYRKLKVNDYKIFVENRAVILPVSF